MKQQVTFNELLLFACNETSLSDTVRVETALSADPVLRETFRDIIINIQAAEREISKISYAPGEECLSKVFNYSRLVGGV